MSEPVTFSGASGSQLAGLLHRASGVTRGSALFAHCFTCSKDTLAARRIAEALAACGITVLRFDFTGLGESEGDFADTNFSSSVDDLLAAAAYLRASERAPSLLVGHSLGGAAVLAAAAHIPEVKAIATIGAPADPAHVKHLLSAATDELKACGEAEVILAGRPFRIKQQFLDDLDRQSLTERIGHLGKALLICHAPLDNLVALDNARLIYQAARHPKSFLSLDGADHLLRRVADAQYTGEMIAVWALRYMDEVRAGDTGDWEVVVTGGPYWLGQDIQAGRHRLRADEPTKYDKGQDTGPNTYELLLASLGSCTSMTLRMYADRKEWPLGSVRVRLRHKKIDPATLPDYQGSAKRVDYIERDVELSGPLTDEQKARIMEIAERCPIHRTLHNEVIVHTRMIEPSED